MKIQYAQGDAAAELSNQIEDALLASLRSANTQSENISFVLSSHDEQEKLCAGLSASTSYGWLLIKTLWVDEKMRRTGLGKSLMQEAEDRARKFACHSAWLDTSSAQARSFYQTLGYADFGKLENNPNKRPANHRRWFMKKTL